MHYLKTLFSSLKQHVPVSIPRFFSICLILFIFTLFNKPAAAGDCFKFSDSEQLQKRYKQWEQYLSKIPQDQLFDMIIGVIEPPDEIKNEVKSQSECLINYIYANLQSGGKSKPKREIISWVRSYNDQNSIWTRKYNFNINFQFGIITISSIKTCRNLIERDETAWNPKKKSHTNCWKNVLNSDQRQLEILQTSSAPGISRHHWGTDMDLFDPQLSADNWEQGKEFWDIYKLLKTAAGHYGFFQPYGPLNTRSGKGYLEERWHWSYYPVSEALLDIIKKNQKAFDAHLKKHWGNKKYYSYVKDNWRDYVLGITPINNF